MGCQTSKHTIGAWYLEDSVHVALSRDKKANGNAPKGYIPRAPHPLLVPKDSSTLVDDNTMKTHFCGYESEDASAYAELDAERLLFHTAHHDNIVDPRDIDEFMPGTRAR